MLAGYGRRCAISRLPEPRLLDAAHIAMDADEHVANGSTDVARRRLWPGASPVEPLSFLTLFRVRWLPSNVQAERLKGGGALSIGGPRKRPELRPPSIPKSLQLTCRNPHFLVRKPFRAKLQRVGKREPSCGR